jgi:hypothetical protein
LSSGIHCTMMTSYGLLIPAGINILAVYPGSVPAGCVSPTVTSHITESREQSTEHSYTVSLLHIESSRLAGRSHKLLELRSVDCAFHVT